MDDMTEIITGSSHLIFFFISSQNHGTGKFGLDEHLSMANQTFAVNTLA